MKLGKLLKSRAGKSIATLLLGAVIVGSVLFAGNEGGDGPAGVLVGFWGVFFAALAVVFIFWRPWAPKPELTAALYVDGRTLEHAVMVPERPMPVLDVEQIIQSEVDALKATIPAPPQRSRRNPWESVIPQISADEPYETSVRRFAGELDEYERDLRQWLSAYQHERRDKAHYIAARLRLENVGNEAAHEVRVRLKLPPGLRCVDRDPQVDALPQRPNYQRRSLASSYREDIVIPPVRSLNLGLRTDERLGNIEGPTVIAEEQDTVLAFRTSSLPHGSADMSAGVIRLVGDDRGPYEISWKAVAGNLKGPVTGVLIVQFAEPPPDHEPLTVLEEITRAPQVPIAD